MCLWALERASWAPAKKKQNKTKQYPCISRRGEDDTSFPGQETEQTKSNIEREFDKMSVTAVIEHRSRVQKNEARKQDSWHHEALVSLSRAVGPYPQNTEKPGSAVE